MIEQQNLPATSSNQSTDKALVILEYLIDQPNPVRLVDISAALKLNSSTVSRFLTTLQNRGYVSQNPDTLHYYPTFKICWLANKINDRLELRTVTHPYLIALSSYFQESTCVSVERDMRMVYVDVVSGPGKTLMGIQKVGNTSPMHCTGNGKLALLNYSEQMIDELIAQRGLPKFTENTIIDKEALLRKLDEIRNAGFAVDEEETEIGLRCIAYPLYNYTNKIIAGISVTAPASRLTVEIIEKKRSFLKETAEQISRELGYKS
jgi:DNA-binding IclR family transcriptional regulator